jgi:hypothetical protein
MLVVQDEAYTVRLIDYSQIHHADFHYCKQYECFSPASKRVAEDLANSFWGKLGNGFRTDIIGLQKECELDNSLLEAFDNTYRQTLISALA